MACFVMAETKDVRGDSWFKLPNLNPFASKKKTADQAEKKRDEQPDFNQPAVRPETEPGSTRSPLFGSSRTTATKRPSGGPSTWDKFNQGTKDFFTKTKHFLMPWTNKSNKSSTDSRRATGRTGTTYSGSKSSDKESEKDTQKSKSIFSSFRPERLNGDAPKPEEKIDSANDFLRLPRPRIE